MSYIYGYVGGSGVISGCCTTKKNEEKAEMNEDEMMRHYAEAHGCGEYGDFHEYCKMIDEDGYPKLTNEHIHIDPDSTVRPLPCVRDEHGETREQTVKALFAKIDEELNELKEAVFRSEEYDNDCAEFRQFMHDFEKSPIAEEAADTITAITTLLEALGIDADMRDEAQRKVNEKNRERGRL